MAAVRGAAVAGAFYPADRNSLESLVDVLLARARDPSLPRNTWPKALIAPHAGYVYSGPVAARAYATIESGRDTITRIVLLGPSHHVPLRGLAVPSHTGFETPLGRVPVDRDGCRRLLTLRFVHTRDDAHRWEHSLEVQLPFLQATIAGFSVLPIVVGQAAPGEVSEALELAWGGDETLIVVSSDLSHDLGYATARRMDATTASAIESLDSSRIGDAQACGRIGIQGLLEAATRHSLGVETLDLRSSGDTAGGRRRVVGYGAWAFTAAKNGSP